MKTYLIIFSFSLLNTYCISQERIITGEVYNAENNESLAYVNIGIANKSTGTVSDFNGAFKLNVSKDITDNDSVIFSYIGFKSQKYCISDLLNKKNTILLIHEEFKLNEVLISANKLKAKKIGRSTKGLGLTHYNLYSYYEKDVNDRLSKEMGMKFRIRKNCHIKDLNFNITSNQFKSLKFRVNFYTIENGLPTDLIVQKNIIFEIKDAHLGWFKVDLEPYNIFINKELEHIAVTIQWVESNKLNSKSKYFSISTAATPIATSFYRNKAMDSWTKAGQNLSFYLNVMSE